jgi:hypothetical protein
MVAVEGRESRNSGKLTRRALMAIARRRKKTRARRVRRRDRKRTKSILRVLKLSVRPMTIISQHPTEIAWRNAIKRDEEAICTSRSDQSSDKLVKFLYHHH